MSQRRRSSSRACKGKGGKWFRLPRPRPKTQSTSIESPEEGGRELQPAEEQHYDSCDDSTESEFIAALITAAQNAAQVLQNEGHLENAADVTALCQQMLQYRTTQEDLQAECEQTQVKLKTVKHKLREAKQQVKAQANLQGQGARWWRKAQELQRRLDFQAWAHSRERHRWYQRPP